MNQKTEAANTLRESSAGLGHSHSVSSKAREPKPLSYNDPQLPQAQGLYDPALEKDSCGVGFVADMKRGKSHGIIKMGLQILLNLDHRGAVGAEIGRAHV